MSTELCSSLASPVYDAPFGQPSSESHDTEDRRTPAPELDWAVLEKEERPFRWGVDQRHCLRREGQTCGAWFVAVPHDPSEMESHNGASNGTRISIHPASH
jgi:hypothetical protein